MYKEKNSIQTRCYLNIVQKWVAWMYCMIVARTLKHIFFFSQLPAVKLNEVKTIEILLRIII